MEHEREQRRYEQYSCLLFLTTLFIHSICHAPQTEFWCSHNAWEFSKTHRYKYKDKVNTFHLQLSKQEPWEIWEATFSLWTRTCFINKRKHGILRNMNDQKLYHILSLLLSFISQPIMLKMTTIEGKGKRKM